MLTIASQTPARMVAPVQTLSMATVANALLDTVGVTVITVRQGLAYYSKLTSVGLFERLVLVSVIAITVSVIC